MTECAIKRGRLSMLSNIIDFGFAAVRRERHRSVGLHIREGAQDKGYHDIGARMPRIGDVGR